MIEPAHLWIPPRKGSLGDEAVDLAREAAGWDLDEEQAFAVDATLSYGAGGKWTALETGIIECRQNGKTAGVLQPVGLFDLFLMPPGRILWTAHLFRTSRDSFDDFRNAIDRSPMLSRRVKKISESHGEEAIELHPRRDHPGEPGSKLEFLARSSGGGRGLKGVKRVVFDEALILSSSSLDSVIPTLSARPNPQINYGSSAAKENSEHLHKLVARGRSMSDRSLIWVEYCAPGSWEDPGCERGADCPHFPEFPGCVLDNEELWPCGNHSIGRTRANGSGVTYEYVRGERSTLTPRGFGRERFGWHEVPVNAEGLISPPLWGSRLDAESTAVGRVGVAVDASPDQRSAAVGMAGVREDGKRHWQVLRHDAGIGWVTPHLASLRGAVDFGDTVAVDGSGPAGALIEPLREAGFTVVEVSGRTLVQAWGSFYSDVTEDRGRHIGQFTFDQAIREAATAPSGDVQRFSRRKSSGDICPLVAVVVADHAHRTTPEPAEPLFAWG